MRSWLHSWRIGNDDQHGADMVAAVDDLAHLAGRDGATVVAAEHALAPVDDDRHLAVEHDIDFFERRGIRPGAAAGQELRQADPLVGGAAGFKALQAKADYTAMV